MQKSLQITHLLQPLHQLRNSWLVYDDAVNMCLWKKSPASYYYWWGAPGERSGNLSDTFPSGPPTLLTASFCDIGDSEGNSWKIKQYGPFNSSGGFDWHDILDKLAFSFFEHAQQKAVYLTGMFLGVRNASYSLIGYPPIHNHHSHIQLTSKEHTLHQHVLLNHQDSSCLPGLGGDICNLQILPENHAIRVDGHLFVDALFNDVRQSNSFVMEFYLECALRWSKVPPQHFVHMWKTDVKPGPIFHAFGTFQIPEAAVVWATSCPSFSGRFLNIWVHSHPIHGFREIWYIDGSPEQLGLIESYRRTSWTSMTGGTLGAVLGQNYTMSWGDAGFAWPRCSSNLDFSATSVNKLRVGILSQVRSNRLKFRCIAKVDDAYPLLIGDRQLAHTCFKDANVIVAGQSLTTITFFNSNVPNALQHLHYQGYVVPTNHDEEFLNHLVYPRSVERSCAMSPTKDLGMPVKQTTGRHNFTMGTFTMNLILCVLPFIYGRIKGAGRRSQNPSLYL